MPFGGGGSFPASETPQLRSTPTIFGTGTTTAALNLATIGALPGDLIICWASAAVSSTYTKPTGWVGVANGTQSYESYTPFGPGSAFESMYKWYAADIQGVENLTCTGNIFTAATMALFKPSGRPVLIDNWLQGSAVAGAGPVTVPAITTNRNSSLVIFGGFQDGNGASVITLSTGTGVTSVFTGNSFMGQFAQGTAGAVQALGLQSNQAGGNHWAMIAMSFC